VLFLVAHRPYFKNVPSISYIRKTGVLKDTGNMDVFSTNSNSTHSAMSNVSLGNSGEIPIERASDTDGCPVVCAKFSDKT
jgi:hypothetical protein